MKPQPAALPDKTCRAPAWLRIDCAALAANYNIFRGKAGADCMVAGVIKANGYGLGVEQVLAALENADCPFYYVATLDEALQVRKLTAKPIAVFGGLYHGAEDDYPAHDIIPVLNSLEEISRWQALIAKQDRRQPAIIHIDTGMNRLGLGEDETAQLAANPSLAAGVNVLFALSHFASADEKDSPFTALQYERFLQASKSLTGVKKSLANSSGIFRDTRFHLDQVRPGMALYGLNPVPEANNPMHPVVRLETRILQVRMVDKGAGAGYGETYRFEKDGHAATVALGYADGFLRSLSNRGKLYYKGIPCPIAGRVSMDTVIVDISHLTNNLPQPGETMEVIGPHQDADTLAAQANTIGYEILTDLGRRYHRIYS